MAKDKWDKLDIVGKICIGITVPVVVAVTAAIINNQISERGLVGVKLEIAVGVLSDDPSEETVALRDWAIEILKNPNDDHFLSEEAAAELRNEALPVNTSYGGGGSKSWGEAHLSLNDFRCYDPQHKEYFSESCELNRAFTKRFPEVLENIPGSENPPLQTLEE